MAQVVQLSRWSLYQRGGKHLRDLLGDVDRLLSPAGPLSEASLQVSLSRLAQAHAGEGKELTPPPSAQCVQNALAGHAALYSHTLEAGRHLHHSVKDTEERDRLETELQALEKAWDQTRSGLDGRQEQVNTGVQVRKGGSFSDTCTPVGGSIHL